MSVYLDASVLVALFAKDPFTQRADDFLRRERPALTVSDFAKAEFASAIARRVRTSELSEKEGRDAFAAFDVWTARAVRSIAASSADIATAGCAVVDRGDSRYAVGKLSFCLPTTGRFGKPICVSSAISRLKLCRMWPRTMEQRSLRTVIVLDHEFGRCVTHHCASLRIHQY